MAEHTEAVVQKVDSPPRFECTHADWARPKRVFLTPSGDLVVSKYCQAGTPRAWVSTISGATYAASTLSVVPVNVTITYTEA